MSPHPKDRPASVAAWQQLLHSSDLTLPLGGSQAAKAGWTAAVRENWWVILVALLLLLISVWVTFN
jgi:hypothetical protein